MSAEIAGVHPLAEVWPIYDDVLAEVTESIQANGLRRPPVVDRSGLLIDGRTRYRALQDLGITDFEVEMYEGDDILEYVHDANAGRRHMAPGARAMATALMLVQDGRRENGRWKHRTFGKIGESPDFDSTFQRAVRDCGVVLDFKPDLAPDVVSGAITLNDAFTQADAIRTSADREKILKREKAKREKAEAAAEAERNATIVADLTQAESKFLAYIESGDMTPTEAWAAHREATRKEREAAERERQVLSDRYTSIANACLTANSWGEYEDFQALMADYDPALLNPPQLDRYLSLESLETVRRFADELIAWRNA